MKTAILCGVCTKPKKLSETYLIRFITYVEVMHAEPTAKKTYAEQKEVKRVCRTCTKRMGYKVKQPKIKVLKK